MTLFQFTKCSSSHMRSSQKAEKMRLLEVPAIICWQHVLDKASLENQKRDEDDTTLANLFSQRQGLLGIWCVLTRKQVLYRIEQCNLSTLFWYSQIDISSQYLGLFTSI